MSLTLDEARARVARGAAHLDRVRPGWENRIDVGTLTLHDPCGCIIGQLESPGFDFRPLGLQNSCEVGEAHGWSLITPKGVELEAHWRPLQDAWIEAIAARRHPVTEPQPEALVCD